MAACFDGSRTTGAISLPVCLPGGELLSSPDTATEWHLEFINL